MAQLKPMLQNRRDEMDYMMMSGDGVKLAAILMPINNGQVCQIITFSANSHVVHLNGSGIARKIYTKDNVFMLSFARITNN